MPFKSLAQEGYMHTHPEILGKAGLKEWDSATKGKKLPKHVKKVKGGNTTLNPQSMKAQALQDAPISNLKTKSEFVTRKRGKMGRV